MQKLLFYLNKATAFLPFLWPLLLSLLKIHTDAHADY